MQKELFNCYVTVRVFLMKPMCLIVYGSSRRSSLLRPAEVDVRTLSQMEANCEKKENILKETLLKQRIDSLTEQFTQKNGAI